MARAAAVAAAWLLGGCSSINPINWWHRQEGGKIAEERPAPPPARKTGSAAPVSERPPESRPAGGRAAPATRWASAITHAGGIPGSEDDLPAGSIGQVNQRDGRPAAFYFHPWEIDPDQPRVTGASMRSKLRHYTNLTGMADKLRHLISEFEWGRMDILAAREAPLATELAA